MKALSKSKLMAFRQCARRLWLEVHKPELREDSAQTQASFVTGNTVGDIARKLYDPQGKGQTIDPLTEGWETAFMRTQSLLRESAPIFEAGFSTHGAMALADVLVPAKRGRMKVWHMIEVKSSTSVKDCYRDDVAIQAFVARQSGVPLASVAVAHIDSDWVYPGDGDYRGLLRENDLTEEAFGRSQEVKQWIADAGKVVRKRSAPEQPTGQHCSQPYDCGFYGHCTSLETQARYPSAYLPRVQSKELRLLLQDPAKRDMRHVPDVLLNELQLRVKTHTLSGKVFFDAEGAATDLAPHKLPALFIDFETVFFGVPIWKGIRPYQQIPFQFSAHRLSRTGKRTHTEWLSLSGNDPSREFAEALISACGNKGPIFVYNAAFETTRIGELARRFARLKAALLAINQRIVDLHPVARKRYYHPSQEGSWSIKKVLPAVAPDLSYSQLDGVQDGGMAMQAYIEAIAPETTASRKLQLQKQLLAYCTLDTLAMVRLWRFLAGRQDIAV